MKPMVRNVGLWTAGVTMFIAMIAIGMPSAAHAYWANGVWVPGPYPYYPPPPVYYAPTPGPAVWVPQHWNGYRWVPGHWRAY